MAGTFAADSEKQILSRIEKAKETVTIKVKNAKNMGRSRFSQRLVTMGNYITSCKLIQ